MTKRTQKAVQVETKVRKAGNNKLKEAFLKAESAKAEKAETAKPVEEKSVAAEPKVIIPNSSAMIETINGPVAVINPNLAGPKFMVLMQYVLEDPKGTFMPAINGVRQGHGMNLVDFRTDKTVGFYKTDSTFVECPWYYWSMARTVGCSVTKCITNAFKFAIGENAMKEAKYQNIEHLIWQNMITGFLHELHHARTAIDNYFRIITDDKFREKEEAAADEFARTKLYELATQIDIEPKLSDDMKDMVSEVWDSMDLENSKDPNIKRFVECQEYMSNTGDSWVALSEDMAKEHHIYSTYRDFLRDASGGKADDEAWSAAVPTAEEVLGMIGVDTVMNQAVTTPVAEEINTTFENDQIDEVVYDEEEYEDQQMTNPPGFQGVQQPGGYQPAQQYYQQPQVQQGQYYGNPDAIAANAPQQGYQPATQQYQPTAPQQVNQNVTVGAGTYEKPNMDAPTYQAVVNGLYRKIYNQIFNACQFNPHTPDQIAFNTPNRIKEQIALTPEENMIVKEMDTFVHVNGNEQLKLDVPVNGWISGRFLDKAGELPGFVLALTDLNGNRILRKFLPQNPWKKNAETGQYTGPAVRAQQNNRIAWVLDPMNKGWDRRFYNGTFEMKEQYWTVKEVLLTQNDQVNQQEADHINGALAKMNAAR